MAAPVSSPAQIITAWSFSRWNTFEGCPFKAKCLYIDKLKEPDNIYQARGTAVHKIGEDYVKGASTTTVPLELKFFADEFKKLRKLKALTELQWAFRSDWSPTDWFAKDAWCRIKLDALASIKSKVIVVDYKTGRQYPEHEDQLGLYALGGFCALPLTQEIEAQDWYLDEKKLKAGQERILGADFKRSDMEALKKDWARRTKIMLTTTKFPPKPGDGCRFCHFRKSNDGPCKF